MSKKKELNPALLILGVIIFIVIMNNNQIQKIVNKESSRQETTITIKEPDFRNFYGISWRGTPCDNLVYAKAMGYDYVLYQSGMNKCPTTDKQDMHFFYNQPEDSYGAAKYTSAIDITKTYTNDQIKKYNQALVWKGNATEITPFPENLATGWWFSNITFRPLVDYQQQTLIDSMVIWSISMVKGLEDQSINWRFGGWAWDVPDLEGDWWTARQGGYTGTSWTCYGVPCTGKGVNLNFWNPEGIQSGALHGNITHEYSTYPEGRASMMKKLFSETRKEYPDMKIIYEPYRVYQWISAIQTRSDKLEIFPTNNVLLSQESGDNLKDDILFLTDSRIYSSGLIDYSHVASTTPDVHDATRNLIIAGNAAIKGAWFSWYGRFGGTDGTPNYASIKDVPEKLKMIRVIPGWDNINKVPLTDRNWDSTNKIYKSTLSYADNNVMYSRHPKNGNLYAIILNDKGKITLKEGETTKEIYSTNQLMQRSTSAINDFNINGEELTVKGEENYGRAYIIVTEKSTSVCTQEAKECSDGSFVSRDPDNNCEFKTCPTDEEPTEEKEEQRLDPVAWIKEQWDDETGRILIIILGGIILYLIFEAGPNKGIIQKRRRI